MKKPEHKPSGNSIMRMIFVGMSLIFQVGWILVRVKWLNDYSELVSAVTGLLAVSVVLYLNSKNTNAAMKMPWIMLILAIPVLGLSMYLLFEILGDPGIGKRLRKARDQKVMDTPESAHRAFSNLEVSDPDAASQSCYLWHRAGYPVYENTAVRYFPEGKLALEAMKQDLEKAERFIFMEYFIVEDESSFRELEDILVRKAQQGVEVRLMYDDIGSIGYVNLEFARSMEGIREFHVPVTVFRFAGLSFVTVPGEFYSTLLMPETAAICYANGYYRYITDEIAYDAGHYEAMAAIVARGGGEKLANTIRRLLEKL